MADEEQQQSGTEPENDAVTGQTPAAAAEPADELTALTAERDDLMARLQRVSADFVNYQRRSQQSLDQTREFATDGLIRDMLAVVDNMERGLEAAGSNHADDDPLLTGMQLVHDSLMGVLGRYGLSRIDAVGLPFDPDLHSAMMHQPTDKHPPMTVIQEVQVGYRLKGRTLRPAGVVVAKKPEEAAGE